MEAALYISASIALLALAGLFIFLMRFIGRTGAMLDRTVGQILGEVQQTRIGVMEAMQNLMGITRKVEETIDRLNQSVDRINGQLYQVEGIVSSVREVTGDALQVVHAAKGVVISVIELEQNVQHTVEQPILESLRFISALAKGIRAFRMKLIGQTPEDRYAPLGVPE